MGHSTTTARECRAGLKLVRSLLLIASLPHLTLAEDAAAAQKRLADCVRFLCSDALERRGALTKGIHLAADYLAVQFRECGLRTDCCAGTPFQKFIVTVDVKLGATNALAFVGPSQAPAAQERVELKLVQDFSPLTISGSGKLDLPLVLAGLPRHHARLAFGCWPDSSGRA